MLIGAWYVDELGIAGEAQPGQSTNLCGAFVILRQWFCATAISHSWCA
jgi:hypothetical protein